MSILRTSLQATLVGAALLAFLPVHAAGKTEDRARVIRSGSHTAGPTATLGPGSYLIDFENLSVGDTLDSQYAAWGVTFSPSPYSGTNSPSGGWATNTDLTIVAADGGDTGGLGTPNLVSGNILRSRKGWLAEDGDASILLTFSTPISAFSVDFAGIGNVASTGIDIYSITGTYITTVSATVAGQQTLSYTGSGIGFVVLTPGDYNDWVGIDNISFTVAAAVPEPGTYGMLALGLGVIAIAVRRRLR
ncbi:MAG: PEP-CTERM sorting domain-containing protein [Burkholderiales bacterium]|nr:MAG: PEP-CTERM sorting domain-containing protein [Burkholderiales bacterium]